MQRKSYIGCGNMSPQPNNNCFEFFFSAEVTANKNIKSQKISARSDEY